MARFPAQRRGMAIVPVTQDGRDAVNRVEHGDTVMIAVTRARNVRQHNLFWKLCEVVAEHFSVTKEAIKDEICERTGHVYVEFWRDGSMRLKPKSIAFENMEQDKFEEFFRLAIMRVSEWLGSAPQEVIDHVNELVERRSPPLAPTSYGDLRHSREEEWV